LKCNFVLRDVDVCRDFLKNACDRGSSCKYNHPEGDFEINVKVAPDGRNEHYDFCKDFQNKNCERKTCRFVHATREDADRYRQNGEITVELAEAIYERIGGDTINGIPFCKEFQKSECQRQLCRYWHIKENPNKRFLSSRSSNSNNRMRRDESHAYGNARNAGPGPWLNGPQTDQTWRDHPPQKRHAYDYEGMYQGHADPYSVQATGGPARVAELEYKVAELTAEVDSLRRELRREKDRYEDLYDLFRQNQAATNNKASIPPILSGSYGAAHGQVGTDY